MVALQQGVQLGGAWEHVMSASLYISRKPLLLSVISAAGGKDMGHANDKRERSTVLAELAHLD